MFVKRFAHIVIGAWLASGIVHARVMEDPPRPNLRAYIDSTHVQNPSLERA